jgi:phosphoenolpyruvate---glycerone phosphotransferase subunit DhaL
MLIKQNEFKMLVKKWADVMVKNKDHLIDLDSVVGDSDLGLTMSKGFQTAYDAIKDNDETDIGKLSYFAGKSMGAAVPSTMGTLLAQGFMSAGKSLKGSSEIDDAGISAFFEEFYKGVQNLGKAKLGEKTFLDGMIGSLEVLKDGVSNNLPLEECVPALRSAVEEDMQKTTEMLAKHGRAAIRGEASRGLLDPGAYVAKLMMTEFADLILELSQKA